MREGRVANLGVRPELSPPRVASIAEQEELQRLRAWRIVFPDGRVVYSRGPCIHMRGAHRWSIWVGFADAPEIFVA